MTAMLALASARPTAAEAQPASRSTPIAAPTMVLISIDGLRPEYVIDSVTYGGYLPNLRRMLRDGAYASGVRGVVPTVTYPSHTTLITGASPATHGIVANTTFDPELKNQGGWYWYASDIRVPTLWDVIAADGRRTANVHWPVSVGAPIAANLPQYWRAGTADDRKLLRALSSPGLLDRLERDLGPYADGADETIGGDETRGRFAVRMLETERPAFLTAYLTALDHEQHEHGPLGPRNRAAMRVLERIDGIVGRLADAARRVGGADAVVAVVSDHGFAPASQELDLLPALHEAGLVDVDSVGRIVSWKASIWTAGGSLALMVRDNNESVRQRVRELARRWSADSNFGIARVIEPSELEARRAFPGAEVVLALKPGVTSGSQVISTVTRKASVLGMHGYWPDVPEMRSAFFIVGRGVPRGSMLGDIDMRAIAPTLASLLGVTLPAAEQEAIFAHAEAK